jgi:hypothetical protein
MDAILAQTFLSPLTLHTRTLPVQFLRDANTFLLAQLFFPKQFLTLSPKQHPDLLPRFLRILFPHLQFR